MTKLASMSASTTLRLDALVKQLDQCDGAIDKKTARRLLDNFPVDYSDVVPYVEERADTYNRRCVARRENYELLVLTWAPGQGSVAHDHSGSLCGLKVIVGDLTEQHFKTGPDGQVRRSTAQHAGVGQILIDPGVIVHALRNDSDKLLITLHIYSPPLPEVRRYAVADKAPAEIFLRKPASGSRVISVIGGGFTGTMTLANLLKLGTSQNLPLHLVMIDQQAAFGEGAAYRTNDSRHLLNVPAARMSAWPEVPDDFLRFAQSHDPSVAPGQFCSRRMFGQYVRETLLGVANGCSSHLSVELIRDQATRLAPDTQGAWMTETARGRSIRSDLAVITLGHRPPDDPLGDRWNGPRHRLISDPWAALTLSQIGPHEPVLLLGTGLTAIDAILTLDRPDRVAPIVAVSRHGLLSHSHALEPKPPTDVSDLVQRWLRPETRLTVRASVSELRRRVREAKKLGIDWRQVIDGLRPVVSQLWQRLDSCERRRFLGRLRSFWEVHRHRMAPDVAARIEALRSKGTLEILRGSLQSATADDDGVDAMILPTGGARKKILQVSWVINCTGPGVHNRHTTHPVLRPLLQAGALCEDELHLGLLTDSAGRALDRAGNPQQTLFVAGTLRKSTLWESTAVPELREQAQTLARTAIESLKNRS